MTSLISKQRCVCCVACMLSCDAREPCCFLTSHTVDLHIQLPPSPTPANAPQTRLVCDHVQHACMLMFCTGARCLRILQPNGHLSLWLQVRQSINKCLMTFDDVCRCRKSHEITSPGNVLLIRAMFRPDMAQPWDCADDDVDEANFTAVRSCFDFNSFSIGLNPRHKSLARAD